MHDPEKSNSGRVAAKPTNKAGQPAAEPVEPRPGTKGNADQQSMHRTQSRARVTQALDRVRQAARQRKKGQFTALLHHVNADTLRTAFYALKRKAAAGVDGVTWHDYEADLEPRIEDLHGRVHRGAYRPQPSRPDKTRLIEFGRFAAVDRKRRGLGKPETFAFLGFTFICGKSRQGSFQLHRKTRRDRMRAKLKDIKAELRRRMHQPIPTQGLWLKQVATGHFAYYAVPTNSRALSAFRHYVTDLWRRALRRRSQKDGFTWERMTKLVDDWLPQPHILHPWPDVRFDVKHLR